jgi:Lon protease-like protein
MMGECLAKEAPFGVIRALEEGIANVGCTAEILTVTKEYPDGRLDLISEGRHRFEVLQLNEERSFLRADISLVPDETGSATEEARARAAQLHLEILSLAGPVQDLSTATPSQLSFHLAGSLPLELDFKQKLLTTRSEGERLQLLTAYLEEILPKLRLALTARQRAGGNGHGP